MLLDIQTNTDVSQNQENRGDDVVDETEREEDINKIQFKQEQNEDGKDIDTELKQNQTPCYLRREKKHPRYENDVTQTSVNHC